METKVVNTDFRINIPLQKSDRTDGWFITGVAAGTEPDLQGDAFSEHAISMAAAQINSNPLPFMDWHKRESSFPELGEVTKAWVDESNRLNVEVELDQDHYGARTLWSRLTKGKQFGMSVHGNGLSYHNDFEGGRPVRRINSVLLDEISITTKPVYTPSFGTVLSKAIESADSVETGDDFSMNEETPAQAADETTVPQPEEAVVETTVETPDAPVADEPVADAAPDENVPAETQVTTEVETTVDTDVPQSPENEQVEVEKAIVVMGKRDAKKLKMLLEYNQKANAIIKELGLDDGAVAEDITDKPVEETPVVSKSEEITVETVEVPVQDPAVAALEAKVAELSKALSDALDLIPQKTIPGVLSKAQETDPLASFLQNANARDRLRFGLAGTHGEIDILAKRG